MTQFEGDFCETGTPYIPPSQEELAELQSMDPRIRAVGEWFATPHIEIHKEHGFELTEADIADLIFQQIVTLHRATKASDSTRETYEIMGAKILAKQES